MARQHAVVPTDSRWVTPAQGPQLVRWGSVFSGTIIAIAVFALLSALWLALSFGSHVSVVYSNLSWWVGGTAIFCLFLAGVVAGVTSGARGAGAGAMGGLTTWALVVLGAVVLALPTFAIGHIPNTITADGHVYTINYLTYWSAFWSLLVGLGAAGFGGIVGGAMNRSVDEPYLDLQASTGPTLDMDRALAPATPVVAGPPYLSGQPVASASGEPTRQVVYQEPVNLTSE
jgi:hypothetical protein